MRYLLLIVLVMPFVGCNEIQDRPASAGSFVETGMLSQALNVCADGETVEGIDVSHWQGEIDWDAVAGAGIKFAVIRVSDGTRTLDRHFARNWAEAQRVGMIRGIYQYFRSGQDVEEQARILLDRMGMLGPGLMPPVIDLEDLDGGNNAELQAAAFQWIRLIEQETGVRPMIYTGSYFWDDHLQSRAYGDYPLWIAQWGPDCPRMPSGWDRWAMHQYSATGRVAGINGDVDRNRFNGSLEALHVFAGGMALCGDGVCSPGETGRMCPADCPHCEVIPADGRIITEQEPCFLVGGPVQYWREEAAGHGNHLYWTHTTDNENAANYAVWNLDFDQAGHYRVEAYTSAQWARSQRAEYTVAHRGAALSAVIAQTAVDGWNLIGEFPFAQGANQSIRLNDNTGEPNGGMVKLVADAIRLTRLDGPQPLPDTGVEPSADTGLPMAVDAGIVQADSMVTGMGQTDAATTDWMVSMVRPDGALGSSGQSQGIKTSSSGGCTVTQTHTHPMFLLCFVLLGCALRRVRRVTSPEDKA